MPASQHLTKLTYLFEVAADDAAPAGLKSDVLNYLYSEEGMGRVMAALQPIETGDDQLFESLADRARPIAQAARVYDVLAAFADEMPKATTLRQALTFARVAHGHYVHQTGQGELIRSKDLVADPRLTNSQTHTIYGPLAAFVQEHDGEDSNTRVDSRSPRYRLSPSGVVLLRRVLHRMRVAQRDADDVGKAAMDSPVQNITDHIRSAE